MNKRSPITTHILDTTLGIPAGGVEVILEIKNKNHFILISKKKTDDDGRIEDFLSPLARPTKGTYRITFKIEKYFKGKCFYPEISILFKINNHKHYHVPLLLNPYGYSTYRGS